jgi:hypothetical protein
MTNLLPPPRKLVRRYHCVSAGWLRQPVIQMDPDAGEGGENLRIVANHQNNSRTSIMPAFHLFVYRKYDLHRLATSSHWKLPRSIAPVTAVLRLCSSFSFSAPCSGLILSVWRMNRLKGAGIHRVKMLSPGLAPRRTRAELAFAEAQVVCSELSILLGIGEVPRDLGM